MADGVSMFAEVSERREVAAMLPALKFPVAARVAGMSASKTMAVSALAEQLRRGGADVLDLGAGEPDFPTPENVRRAAYNAMENGHTKYTPAAGTLRLKRAICDRFAADFGAAYEPAEVFGAPGYLRLSYATSLDTLRRAVERIAEALTDCERESSCWAV